MSQPWHHVPGSQEQAARGICSTPGTSLPQDYWCPFQFLCLSFISCSPKHKDWSHQAHLHYFTLTLEGKGSLYQSVIEFFFLNCSEVKRSRVEENHCVCGAGDHNPVEKDSVGRDFRNPVQVQVMRSGSDWKTEHKWLRAQMTLQQSTHQTNAKAFCPQRLGNWVLETPEGKTSRAQQKPRAIPAGRGITEAS